MIKVKANNNATIAASVKTPTGQVQDVTGWSFQFRVRIVDGQTLGAVLFDKSSTNPLEIFITDAVNGKVSVYILPANTNNHVGQFKYELRGTDTSGNIYTLDQGDFVIERTLI